MLSEKDTDRVFDRALAEMEGAFRRLEEQVPHPVIQPMGDGYTMRYVEQSVQQAMLQKFARMISGLHSARLLIKHGFLQEFGVILRTLGDFEEDIYFIVNGVINDDWTQRHQDYLDHHWMVEQGDSGEKRQMVKRDKIRAYVAATFGDGRSSYVDAGRSIFKGYSGFVHGSGETIIDMCMTDPPRYLLNGMLESPLYSTYRSELWNYIYRGLTTTVWMARLFADEELERERYRSMAGFEEAFSRVIF